jgi:hypothetical protein
MIAAILVHSKSNNVAGKVSGGDPGIVNGRPGVGHIQADIVAEKVWVHVASAVNVNHIARSGSNGCGEGNVRAPQQNEKK